MFHNRTHFNESQSVRIKGSGGGGGVVVVCVCVCVGGGYGHLARYSPMLPPPVLYRAQSMTLSCVDFMDVTMGDMPMA